MWHVCLNYVLCLDPAKRNQGAFGLLGLLGLVGINVAFALNLLGLF